MICDYESPYNVEILEFGLWETVYFTKDFLDALYFASNLVRTEKPEERVRLLDNKNRII